MTDNFRDEWMSLQGKLEDLYMAHGLDVVTMCLQNKRIEELENAVRALAKNGMEVVRKLEDVERRLVTIEGLTLGIGDIETRLNDLEDTVGEMLPVNFVAAMPVEIEEE